MSAEADNRTSKDPDFQSGDFIRKSLSMAYMRGDYYLWDDESGLHLWAKDGYDSWDKAGWHEIDETADGEPIVRPEHITDGEITASGVSIHQDIMDEYVMMRLTEMIDEGLVETAIDRVLDPDGRGGNFGSKKLRANADILKQALGKVKMRPTLACD